MKSTAFAVSVLAILVAVAGVAGYMVVAHGSLPSAPAPSGAGGVGTLNVYVMDLLPANATMANGTTGNQTPGNVSVGNVTWSHIYVTFTVLQAHEANATNESGWHNISVSQTVDLLSLKTVSALLGSASLPTGEYTQLRIVVAKAWGVTSTGKTYDFTVPSGDLRTDDPFNVTTGQTASLTLDVNLSHSVVWTANGYLFTPVIGSIQSS